MNILKPENEDNEEGFIFATVFCTHGGTLKLKCYPNRYIEQMRKKKLVMPDDEKLEELVNELEEWYDENIVFDPSYKYLTHNQIDYQTLNKTEGLYDATKER